MTRFPLSVAWLALVMAISVGIAHSATRVFYDGSEAGNTALWSQDDYRDKCTSVTSSADGVAGPYAGSRMIRCNDNGTVAWNAHDAFETMKLPAFSATSEVFYRIRVRLDQNMDKTSGSAKKLLRIFGNTDTYESVRTQSGMNWCGFFNSNANQIPSYWGDAPGDYTAQTSGWHLLEYYYNRSTGAVKVWHDEVLVSSSTIPPFGSMGQNQDFYLTSNFSDAHDATNYVYFDEFEAYSDSTGGTPATGLMSNGSITVSGGVSYTVTPSAGANGSISPNTAQTVSAGGTATFTITPNSGYTASVGGTCGGSPTTAAGAFVYTTNIVNANCSVTATFAGDTTPPVISAPLPSGEQPYNTSSVTLQVTTNETATCRYNATDVSYASMGSTFGTTGGTTHQQTGFATTNGSSYTRYVRCIDSANNANTTSALITFSVAATNDVILDNDGAGVTQSGDWSPSAYFPGYYGLNYHYAPDVAGSWFQWSGTLSSGNYAVYARWPAAAGRPNDVVYEITHSGGTASVSANQTTAGAQWNLLGTYTFGTTGTVRLLSSANGTEGAAADAIRFSASTADTTPPTLSSLLPSGDLSTPTTSVNLAVTTNEAATCRFGLRGTQYSGMAVLSTTGSTSHSHTLATRYGMVYEICFRCQDGSANVSTESCTRFAVPDLPKRRGSR